MRQSQQPQSKVKKTIEAEVQRINKLMNVDVSTFPSNVSRLRI